MCLIHFLFKKIFEKYYFVKQESDKCCFYLIMHLNFIILLMIFIKAYYMEYDMMIQNTRYSGGVSFLVFCFAKIMKMIINSFFFISSVLKTNKKAFLVGVDGNEQDLLCREGLIHAGT